MNTYGYVYGNPVGLIDPLGLGASDGEGETRYGEGSDGSMQPVTAAEGADLVRQIQQYDPTFEVIGPASQEGNEILRQKLEQLEFDAIQKESAENSCSIEKDPRTPIGRRGNPMDVPRGTNKPTTIDNRYYTGHALDQMQGRGVTPSAVENTIQNGDPYPGNQPDTTLYVDSTNGVAVATNSSGGVITVMTAPR